MYGRSTGKVSRDEAAGVATDWLKNGIPVPKTRVKRPLETRMTLDAVHVGLHTLSLTPDDVQKFIDILKSRNLLDSAIVTSAASSQVLIDYLTAFWDYDTSPYIKETLLHGQTIGRMRAMFLSFGS